MTTASAWWASPTAGKHIWFIFFAIPAVIAWWLGNRAERGPNSRMDGANKQMLALFVGLVAFLAFAYFAHPLWLAKHCSGVPTPGHPLVEPPANASGWYYAKHQSCTGLPELFGMAKTPLNPLPLPYFAGLIVLCYFLGRRYARGPGGGWLGTTGRWRMANGAGRRPR